jgi:hypothetical protein
MLAILCKPQDKHGEGGPEKPFTNDKAPKPTAPPSALPKHPDIESLLMDVSSFNRQWWEEGKSMSPSSYQI